MSGKRELENVNVNVQPSVTSDRVRWVPTLVSVGLFAVQIGCGGALSPAAKKCRDTYQHLVEKNEDDVCSPILYDHFESQVKEWQGECGPETGTTFDDQQKVKEKLKSVSQCSEKKRRVEMLVGSCSNQLEKLNNAQICLGDECQPYVDELEKIKGECLVPELDGKYEKEITSAARVFEERIENATELQALRSLIITCDGVQGLDSIKQARIAMNDLVDAVAVTEVMLQIPKENSEVARFRQGAIDSCSYAFLSTMETLCGLPPKEIDHIMSSRRRVKRYVAKYQRYRRRLLDINAGALFPSAMAPLTEVLKTLGVPEEEAILAAAPLKPAPPPKKQEAEAEPVSEPVSEPVADTKASSTADTSDPSSEPPSTESAPEPERDTVTASNPFPGKGADSTASTGESTLSAADKKKCKALKKKLKHFTAKRNAYEKKGNQGKIKAYRTKQEKTQDKMMSLGCPTAL